ncbi:molybdopterin molybdotransferase MoeA [Leptospira jelokensis]|uniref:Molybdopterin molybdenumtransferase n=1 Tax=Leptospira jelokensis TaxID=2484931 RepID=A0A4Z1A8M9_9LEPT|nr:molybdopterin molybdotransferase MoeA [Leptospira jelokensis]TGL75973.1 molybdopterin molybdenumtransferase MoeA [Leptospira jelokensis]
MIPYEEAIQFIDQEAKSFGTESVPLLEAYGRILAESVLADRDYPPFNRSAMDGFAIALKDFEANKQFVYERELHAGSTLKKLPEETVIRIMTGAPVPEGFDVVIKIEDTILSEHQNQKMVKFPIENVSLWQNIAKQGEDAIKSDPMLSVGTYLNLSEVSLLASLGTMDVTVFSLPKVKIISTGNEVVPFGVTPLPHQIRDSNSVTISTFLKKWKITPIEISRVPDDVSIIKNTIEQSLDCDILILSGGVSMGEMDLVPSILKELGVETIFHKTAIKPGKPIWFGKKKKTIVFGLPGNPFSVQTCLRIFIDPFLRSCFSQKKEVYLKFPISQTKKKKHSLTEFFPVRFTTNEKTRLEAIAFNGSGDIKAGIFSDGLALFPSESKEILSESSIQFLPW